MQPEKRFQLESATLAAIWNVKSEVPQSSMIEPAEDPQLIKVINVNVILARNVLNTKKTKRDPPSACVRRNRSAQVE